LANLELIDEIVNEVAKAREINLPKICIKVLFLSYWMYCVNTYDLKYRNSFLGRNIRLNSGCIILCEKGTGKSLAVSLFKELFSEVELERVKRYEKIKEVKIGSLERSMIPLNSSEKKQIDDFYIQYGRKAAGIYRNVATSKSLCNTYASCKRYNVNNLLFNVDEAGKIFEDVFSKTPSISAREFYQSINELFDGFCGMGESMVSKTESIESQVDIGANFIFTSTNEFLKDYHVQKKYESSFAGGLARRLLYVNCPPIDLINADANFYTYDVKQFQPQIAEILKNMGRSRSIAFGEELKTILAQPASKKGVIIFDEYLILLFCTTLAAWTGDEEIGVKHWNYMLSTFKEMKNITMDVIKDSSTSYDKVCVFIREMTESTGKKKIAIVLIKDYCVRNKMCFDSKFKKWFETLCKDFTKTNVSKYIIEKNQMYAWLTDNFAFEGGK